MKYGDGVYVHSWFWKQNAARTIRSIKQINLKSVEIKLENSFWKSLRY